jgi:ankyrin repeat protein
MSTPVSSGNLPENPSFEQLRKQAKELLASGVHPNLASAQRALALQYGFPSWPKMKTATEAAMLRRCIGAGDAEGVRKLLQSSPKLALITFPEGDTPLHHASEMNRPDLVEILVRAGAPLNTPYAHSAHTALSWGITVGSMEAARKLVDLGCTPDLFCAAGLGLLDVLKNFWPDGTLLPHPSTTGSSRYAENGDRLPCPPPNDADQVSDALYIACRSNRLDAARWLLDHGADPNWRGFCGASCLAWAEFAGNAELTALLRERGGSDELRDTEFRATPKVFGLMVLTAWGFPRLLRARLTADPSLVDAHGGWGTLLNVAAFNGQMDTAKVLLEFGAHRNKLNAAGLTPTQMAASRGHKELAILLA